MLGLLDMSLLAGILIAAVTAARTAFGGKLSGKAMKALWAIVILRMLVPLSLPINGLHGSAQETAAIYVYEDSGGTFHNALFTVYFAVMAVLALFFAVIHIRFRLKVRDCVLSETLKASFGRTVRVKTSDRIDSPLTYGIIRPVILIPKKIGREKNAVLAHESVHIDRFDVLYKLLMTAAVCIHWFNPLAWLMFVLANRDLEFSCDDEAVKRANIPRKEYALALIGMEERRSFGVSFFGGSPLKKRITSVMTVKKFSPVGVVLIVIALLVFTFYDPEPVMISVTVSADNYLISQSDAVYSEITEEVFADDTADSVSYFTADPAAASEITEAVYTDDTVYKAYFFTDDSAE